MRDIDYYRTSLKKHATIASISRHASILDADITGNRNELGIGLEKSNSKRVFSRSSTRLKKAASFRRGSGKTPRKVSDKTPSLKKTKSVEFRIIDAKAGPVSFISARWHVNNQYLCR